MKETEQEFTQKITRALDGSLASDAATQDRLAAMRVRALAEIPDSGNTSRAKTWWVVSGASAAAILFASLFIVLPDKPQVHAPEIVAFEWILYETDADMVETDLEFYEWAAEMERNSG